MVVSPPLVVILEHLVALLRGVELYEVLRLQVRHHVGVLRGDKQDQSLKNSTKTMFCESTLLDLATLNSK